MAPFLNFDTPRDWSLQYAGAPAREQIGNWRSRTSRQSFEDGTIEQVTHEDPVTGLRIVVHRKQFSDFPAQDWFLELSNDGSEPTPLLENILPLDTTVPITGQERLRLHHANGSSCRMDDFLPLTTELPPQAHKVLAPSGGRSSNSTFPFMNLQRDGSGLVLAIGWSGQWMARFERGPESVRLAAGMERTSLRLLPGETIRTPRILGLLWQGDDPEVGTNLLRQLLLAHYLPRVNGELVKPPAAQCLQAYYYLTGQAGEKLEMTALPKAAAIGAEAYWIDACWYGDSGQWWEEVGSWMVNRAKFPNGLKPISDAAHQAGMKFVLWFEPERARRNSRLDREHPEFLLRNPSDPDNQLFNLGLPEARRHLTDLVSHLIMENGVDIYRQDFNVDPLPYWQAADTPDRVGMTEIRHIEGLYAFWDELRCRHPQMWIDNCASGGRRIDLETMSRSLPLWPSDFPDVCGLPYGLGLHVGDQCINAGLARWVPFFGGGVWNFTPYGTRSEIMGGFTFGFHIQHADFPPDEVKQVVGHNDVLGRGKTLLDAEFPLAAAREAVAEWKSIRPFFVGDFHLLLPLTVSSHDWCAWQLHRADLDAGIALFFRRHRSPFPTMAVQLKEVATQEVYEVSFSARYSEAPRKQLTGKNLASTTISIPEAPGSLLLRYQRVK